MKQSRYKFTRSTITEQTQRETSPSARWTEAEQHKKVQLQPKTQTINDMDTQNHINSVISTKGNPP